MDSYTVQKLMLYQRLADTEFHGGFYAEHMYTRRCSFAMGLYYEESASVYKFIHDVDRVALVDCRPCMRIVCGNPNHQSGVQSDKSLICHWFHDDLARICRNGIRI